MSYIALTGSDIRQMPSDIVARHSDILKAMPLKLRCRVATKYKNLSLSLTNVRQLTRQSEPKPFSDEKGGPLAVERETLYLFCLGKTPKLCIMHYEL